MGIEVVVNFTKILSFKRVKGFQYFIIVMHLSLGGSLDSVICPIDGALYRLPTICVTIL